MSCDSKKIDDAIQKEMDRRDKNIKSFVSGALTAVVFISISALFYTLMSV